MLCTLYSDNGATDLSIASINKEKYKLCLFVIFFLLIQVPQKTLRKKCLQFLWHIYSAHFEHVCGKWSQQYTLKVGHECAAHVSVVNFITEIFPRLTMNL